MLPVPEAAEDALQVLGCSEPLLLLSMNQPSMLTRMVPQPLPEAHNAPHLCQLLLLFHRHYMGVQFIAHLYQALGKALKISPGHTQAPIDFHNSSKTFADGQQRKQKLGFMGRLR